MTQTQIQMKSPPARRGPAPEVPPEASTVWLKTAEVAARVRVHPQTVARWRWDGSGPPYSLLPGRRVRYSAAAVDAWLASRGTCDGAA